MPTELAEWHREGTDIEVGQHSVFVHPSGPEGAPVLAILHGFPTSSFDFHLCLPVLEQRLRIVAHDHLGFGLSAKPVDYSYSLFEQADAAVSVWKALGVERVHLLAHDYGTSVATELLARRERGELPIEIDTVTLCNGSMHIELAQLTWMQKLLTRPTLGPLAAKLSSKAFFHTRIRNILGSRNSVSAHELDLAWAALIHDNGRARIPAISSYLGERRRFWHRWIGALTRLDIPMHVLWGRRDPIAVEAIAKQLDDEVPDSTLTWLDDLGHYPMLEDPERWAQAALTFY